MREAVVVAHSRTPLAKSFRGSFNLTRPDDLAAHCMTDVLKKVPQLDPAEIEDVFLGCANPEGTQGMNVARVAAIRAGLPVTVAGATINRFCSSGLQAVVLAAHQVINEGAEAALAGGVESITAIAGRKGEPNEWVQERKPGIYMVMGDTAEVVAKRYKISRETQDEYALSSQQRTAMAQAEGYIDEELTPMTVTRGIIDKKTGQIASTEEHTITKDECNRPDTTLEGLLKLRALLRSRERRRQRHCRQRLANVRRGERVHGNVARAGRKAGHQAEAHFPRLPGRRLRTGRDGHRPGFCRAQAAWSATA